MRLTPLLALLSVTALAAQDGPRSTPPGGHWEFGGIRQAPDLSAARATTQTGTWAWARTPPASAP